MNNDKCAGCDVCRKCQENEALVRGYKWLAHEVGVDYEDSDNDLTDFLLSMSPEDALKVTAQVRKDIQRALCCDVKAGDNKQ